MYFKILIKNVIGFGLGNNLSFRLLRTIFRRQLLILYYHRVIDKEECRDVKLNGMCVNVDIFNKQMAFLAKFYNFVSEEDVKEAIENNAKLPDYPVWITFDDGYKDNYTNALPILKKYNIPATIFVTTGYVNKRISPYMNWHEIKNMAEAGVFIGAHTVSHKILSELSERETMDEITSSKDEIEQTLNRRIISFAYPVGKKRHYNSEKCIPILKKNGFKLAVTTIGGFNRLRFKVPNFELRRMGISYEDTLNFFKFKISLAAFWQR